jgi:hypothetical protein
LAETLSLLPELRAERRILNNSVHFECDELVCPSLPHRVGESDPWGPAFVAECILGYPRRDVGNRRLLISRSTAPRRRLTNEDDIWQQLLHPRGFERVRLEDHSLQEQARLLSTASIVVAPHGAGLSNLVFAPKQCFVVELLNRDWAGTCFWHLSDELGLDYRYIVGEPESGGSAENSDRQHGDFFVDPALVTECLNRIPDCETRAERCQAG